MMFGSGPPGAPLTLNRAGNPGGCLARAVIIPKNKRLENWTSPALIIDGDENEPTAGAANKSRFTEPQIVAILNHGESGVPVPDLCREYGISNATCL